MYSGSVESLEQRLDGILAYAGNGRAVDRVGVADHEVKIVNIFRKLLFQRVRDRAQHFLPVAGWKTYVVQVNAGTVEQHGDPVLLRRGCRLFQRAGRDAAGQLALVVDVRPRGLIRLCRIVVHKQHARHQNTPW